MENTEGTVLYLELIKCGLRAFVDHETSTSERLFNAIYLAFFVRLWRSDLKKNKISMNCFITQSCFEGIEMNIVWLLRLIIDKRVQSVAENSSQQCESEFRHIRSLTGVQNSQINCTSRLLMSRLHKIELAEKIMFDLKDVVVFPDIEKRKKRHQHTSPDIEEDEINIVIDTAIFAAIEKAKEMGINYDEIQLKDLLKPVIDRSVRAESPNPPLLRRQIPMNGFDSDDEDENEAIDEHLVLQNVEFCDIESSK